MKQPKNLTLKFKTGDRVRPSGYDVNRARDYWLNQGREPMKSGAKKALDDMIAKRGTVLESAWNGDCVAVSVQWDNGNVSHCMEHKVEIAQD